MTIEEKAKEYESNIGSQDYVPIEIEEAFKAGAEWMIEKAVAVLVDSGVFGNMDSYGAKAFRKAMEE